MKAWNKEKNIKSCNQCHEKLLPKYELKKDGLVPRRTEGQREARWILMDYLDAVVHIFTPDAREYYRLEQLWGEAPARTIH